MNLDFYIFAEQGFTLFFYIIALCYALFSMATFYHWFTYGTSKSITTISVVTYLIVSVPLFIVMGITLSKM